MHTALTPWNLAELITTREDIVEHLRLALADGHDDVTLSVVDSIVHSPAFKSLDISDPARRKIQGTMIDDRATAKTLLPLVSALGLRLTLADPALPRR